MEPMGTVRGLEQSFLHFRSEINSDESRLKAAVELRLSPERCVCVCFSFFLYVGLEDMQERWLAH